MPKVIRVYRLETEDGKGPFYGGAVHKLNDRLGLLYFKSKKRPKGLRMPRRDPRDMPSPEGEGSGPLYDRHRLLDNAWKGYCFGFSNLLQYKRAFLKVYRQHLGSEGIMMRVYAVPEDCIIKGKAQCAFTKDRATLVHTYNPAEFG